MGTLAAVQSAAAVKAVRTPRDGRRDGARSLIREDVFADSQRGLRHDRVRGQEVEAQQELHGDAHGPLSMVTTTEETFAPKPAAPTTPKTNAIAAADVNALVAAEKNFSGLGIASLMEKRVK